MKLMKRLLVLTVICVLFSSVIAARDYPARPITLIIPYAAGGGTDLVGRTYASIAERIIGGKINVVNKVGGSGAVGWTEAASSRPDGYTITLIAKPLCVLPKLDLSPVDADDFNVIALLNEDPAILLVPDNSPYKAVKDIMEAAKENPGKVSFASSASPDLYLTALELRTNVKFKLIPYNGAAECITSLLGHHTEFTMVNYGEAASQIKAGTLIPLGVLADERLPQLPNVPTFKELGYPVVSSTWRGLAAPKGTPEEIIKTLADVTAKVVQDPEFIGTLDQLGFSIKYKSLNEFTTFIEDESISVSEQIEYWQTRTD